MFYCHSGHDNITGKHALLWACNNNGSYSLCFARPMHIHNTLLTELNSNPISSLSEIQQYVDSLDYTWDEPCWDVYDENLEYVESVPRLA